MSMQPVITDKGRGILYRKWNVSQPTAVLLLIHGLCGQSSRWDFLAEFFQRNNISSYAIELKGFGETQELAGHIGSFNTYIDDIRRLSDIIHTEHRGNQVFLLGESMGAIISFLTAIAEPDLFSGLICVSPAFKSKLKFSFLEYINIYLSLIYNPKQQFHIPFDSLMFTRDIAYQESIEADSKEHRLATSKMLFNILIAQKQCVIFKNKLKVPLLFLLAGKDLLVNSKTSEKLFNRLRIEDKVIIIYPNMFHALTVDIEREQVFSDILTWIKQRIEVIHIGNFLRTHH